MHFFDDKVRLKEGGESMRKGIPVLLLLGALLVLTACSGGQQGAPNILLALILPLLVISMFYFAFFQRDMAAREENRLAWLVKFLFLGPFAVAWYMTCRRPKEGEVVHGSKFSRLAKYFLLPWSIYVLLTPGLFLGGAVILDLATSALGVEHIGESFFWIVFLYIFIVPVWLVTLAVLGLVALISNAAQKN